MLVLLDDGSDDDTYEKLSILSKDFTTKLVKSEKAKNVAQAKNRALQLTCEFKEQYPYIMMMDIDDEMLPGRVKLLDFLIEKNEKFAVGNFYVTDLNKKVKDLIDVVANRCYCLEGVDDINIIKNFPISEEKILKLIISSPSNAKIDSIDFIRDGEFAN